MFIYIYSYQRKSSVKPVNKIYIYIYSYQRKSSVKLENKIYVYIYIYIVTSGNLRKTRKQDLYLYIQLPAEIFGKTRKPDIQLRVIADIFGTTRKPHNTEVILINRIYNYHKTSWPKS